MASARSLLVPRLAVVLYDDARRFAVSLRHPHAPGTRHLWILRAVTGVALAALLAAGCATGGSSAVEAATRDEIEQSLRRDPLIERLPVAVRVEGTHVALYGDVETAEERQRAEEIAQKTSGVTSVENHLRVAPGAAGGGAGPSRIMRMPGSMSP
jgi:hypothetical protein